MAFSTLSIAQLRAEMVSRGLSTVGMLEKSDFVAALEEHARTTPSPAAALQAALDAIALSRAQSQIVEVQMNFSNRAPLSIHCEFCAKDAPTLKCSKCMQAAYCNSTCQASHWGAHKTACKC